MNDINKFTWLIGQWEGIMGSGIYHEEWELTDENELIGEAHLIKKGELLNNEKLKIHSAEGDIYYTADVSHNEAPVSFKLTEITEKVFIFENPKHDFPQKITYEIINEKNFIATVEAEKDGETRKLKYDLKRIL